MLKAKHHIIINPFFKYYTLWKIRRNFNQVFTNGGFHDKNLPLLVISNHMSWWDGFWINYLNTKIFKRKFHFMMLEKQLRKHWFFQYAGGFSIKKNSRSVVETINYTARLLTDKNNMVLIFPQGKIESLYTDKFNFEKGLEVILQKTEQKAQVLFVANLIDYYSKPHPSLFVYMEDYKSGDYDLKAMQDSYNDFYRGAVVKQKGRIDGLVEADRDD